MREWPSLVGKRFGKLVVEEYADSTASGQRRWLCRCDCGNTCIATTGNLNRGHTTNCGCKKSPDLTGQRFGKLTVLGRSERTATRGKRTVKLWECQCDCGTITYKATDTLKNESMSCCARCAELHAVSQARKSAGFIGGTQTTKLKDMSPTTANSSGCRGVYFDKKSNRWRARLGFKGKMMSFGSYERFEDAVAARKKAEQEYFATFLEENRIN